MRFGQKFIISGAIIGCLLIVTFGLSVTSSLALSPLPRTDKSTTQFTGKDKVSSDNTQSDPQSTQQDECQVNNLYSSEILQWCSIITKYAQKNNLSPNLVAALILQESGGNPSAYSKSGAVGLMQVMPRDGIAATFMCKNGPCFSQRPFIHQLEDPEFNVKYGTKMLSGLQSKYGHMRDALKAYGPMDVGYYYADIVLGIFGQYSQ